MKLLRYGQAGRELPGLLDDDGRIRGLEGNLADIDASALAPERLKMLQGLDPATLPLVEGTPRLGPPVANVGKIIAVGRNYASHAAETKSNVPDEPQLFSKAVTSLSGPTDPIIMPKGSQATDWEVELAFVIGARAQYVAQEDAFDHVAGYTVMLDVSERDYQLKRGGQFVKGKSFDGFGPLGPWLVTADEIPDP
ncbi:MAG TPA: FAA hydrolase family protein, partial [Alphaproteobacteria bacterium]|nr:FAA hydrolase family protein [Alphaproteobacteria bacterium]